MDPEDVGNIVDEVLEDVNFEDAMDIESSDESVLSDDTGCISDLENDTNRLVKIVPAEQIRALNSHMKFCQIQCYYTTGGAFAVCTECMGKSRTLTLVGLKRKLLEQFGRVATLEECFAWMQRCDECVESLEELCRAKRPHFTVWHRQSAVARIARLAGAGTQLERLFVHVGSGGGDRENDRSLVWREIDTAFERHVLTGAVINFEHIEPRQFWKTPVV
ncbi:hypothetical protein ALC62_13668 [Cyphomyrmex costatus]|uniref:Uncharacterized protein n=1 Tax=Cyphomyrmex costatus TaxID=456900 RepID=A0A151I9K1_9HYME|nr:hypothetical protein ALC62_13668 [Cyphomyrmex costatus]